MIAQRAFCNPRLLLTLVLCVAALSIVTKSLLGFRVSANAYQRKLTFAERVAHQRAVEDVYWRHRIWPKERPDPKPPLDAVISQAQLKKKVTDYLSTSQALEDYWQRPITSEQLQAEMDRMAKHTKQPDLLRELFDALGNDPFVIAECLARPLLTERLFQSAGRSQVADEEASQSRIPWHADVTTSIGYSLPAIAGSDPDDGCIDDTWTATTLTTAPSGRASHTAVWTGTEMIIWGGLGVNFVFLNTGGRYNPSTDSWIATSLTDVPAARVGHTAVWTGSEMIIWGGVTPMYSNTGGKYNPVTDSWTATTTSNAPTGRGNHTAIWTGGNMIVWGGEAGGGVTFDTGGRYNPVTDGWTATSTTNVAGARYLHTAVWTGGEMIVWGGFDGFVTLNTGGRYNPDTDSWVATTTANAPSIREAHDAVWTGTEMIIWGGASDPLNSLNTGGRYNPSTNAWLATNTTNTPTARQYHTAVWTGTEMIVLGRV